MQRMTLEGCMPQGVCTHVCVCVGGGRRMACIWVCLSLVEQWGEMVLQSWNLAVVLCCAKEETDGRGQGGGES
jgi:hypothetical protein